MTQGDCTISNHSPKQRFTALAYSADDFLTPPIDPANVIIILVFHSKEGTVEARMRPDWDGVVLEHDREYISAVFEDFRQRVTLDPIQLFEQVSNLSMGPLVTVATGSDLVSDAEFLHLFEEFMAL
jgi:hypothetical protein